MNTIEKFNLKGLKTLIRVDFNVPLSDTYEIQSPNRIDCALPTIRKVLEEGGSVILMSHLGRPKQGPELKFSLRHLINYLSKSLNTNVKFADDCIGDTAKELAENLKPGEVLLLENLRFYKEETKGDKEFAKKLAQLGEFYINDAFATAHRAHASTSIIADYFDKEHKAIGLLMSDEIQAMDKVIKHAKQPFTAILGGAKVSDKIPLIENLLTKVDNLIIGGGMMYTFVRAKGGDIGGSICECEHLDITRKVLDMASDHNVKIYIPEDSVAADKIDELANTKMVDSYNIPKNWLGLDIGLKSRETIGNIILQSKTILWNGPVGVFEIEKFGEGTKYIAEKVAQATAKGAYTLIGGGDTVSALKKYGYKNSMSYVSTGGGAMLEYIEGNTLPGIAALS